MRETGTVSREGERGRDETLPHDGRRLQLQRLIPHILGLAWVMGAAIVTLAPALHHGLSLGPYDILTQSGLTRVHGVTVRNTYSGDQIAEMIPWSTLAWNQVHQGHLPLWNTYSGLGLPLAFNWQSGVFSLPALISYVLPLQFAYTAQIVVTLVIAGSGAYVLARVLGVGVIGCAMAGTVYELSGSLMGLLGYPQAAVMSWAGWIFAVAILIIRGRHRVRYIVAFAVLVALAVYAGAPEPLATLVVSLIVFSLTMLVWKRRESHGQWRSWRPLVDLSVAAVAGAALAAPLALPGTQVLTGSTRNTGGILATTEVGKALPAHDLVNLIVQGYSGLPLAGNMVFDDAVYFETAAYVGLIAIALAVLGVVRSRRRPETVGFVVLALVTLAIIYAPPVEALFIRIPLVHTIDWHRDLMTVGLFVAVLAGMGMDALVRTGSWKSTQLTLAGVLAGGVVLLLVLWVAGTSGLSPLDVHIRRVSLHLPLVTTGLALVLVALHAAWTSRAASRQPPEPRTGRDEVSTPSPGGDMTESRLSWIRRTTVGHVTAAALLLLETVFLVASGASLWSSSADGVQATPAVKSLVHAVGASRVGFGAFTCYSGPGLSSLGVLPESNSLFGLHEFDFYDPILPRGYFQSWAEESPSAPGVPIYSSFCPAITTASQARRYGVSFVLELHGAPAPAGSVFDRKVGNEDLYRIPDSAEAELAPATAPGGHHPATNSSGGPVTVDHPSPSSLRIATSSPRAQVLHLHVTDEPGWHASIDGHPLALEPYAGIMIQARIPAGHHVIELHYWPTLFTFGLLVATLSLLLLVTLVVVSAIRHRSKQRLPLG